VLDLTVAAGAFFAERTVESETKRPRAGCKILEVPFLGILELDSE
jgi:hypothetical protein